MSEPKKLDIYIREDLEELLEKAPEIFASTPGVSVYGCGYALNYSNYFGAATEDSLEKLKQEFSAEGCYVNEYPPEMRQALEAEGFDGTWTE